LRPPETVFIVITIVIHSQIGSSEVLKILPIINIAVIHLVMQVFQKDVVEQGPLSDYPAAFKCQHTIANKTVI
jgi:hypothetical protein